MDRTSVFHASVLLLIMNFCPLFWMGSWPWEWGWCLVAAVENWFDRRKNSISLFFRIARFFVWLTRIVKPHYGITWFIYLFICLSTRVERLSRGLASVATLGAELLVLVVSLGSSQRGSSNFFQVIVSRVSSPGTSQQTQTQLVL